MKTKKVLILMTTVLTLSLLTSANVFAANLKEVNTQIGNAQNVTSIKTEINAVKKLEIFKTLSSAYDLKSKAIMQRDSLDKLNELYLSGSSILKYETKERANKYKQYEESLGISIKSFDSNITIKDMHYNENNKYEVYLSEYINFSWSYLNSNEKNTSEMEVNHIVTLDDLGVKPIIIADVYNEGISHNMESPDFKNYVQATAMSQESNIPQNTNVSISPEYEPGTKSYLRNSAKWYADNYWNSSNPSYVNFISEDSDCANFVSQCLAKGGMPQTSYTSGDNYWWYNSNASGNKYSKSNITWRYCPSQVAYILAHSGVVGTASTVKIGDLVYYKWNSSDAWGHVAIVTGFASNGAPLVSAHTNAVHNVPWNMGAAVTRFVKISDTFLLK